MTKPKRLSKSKLIKRADILFSKYIRMRAICQHCGKNDPKSLQCAHVISRTNKELRWNEDNALCLCYRCHIHWSHKSPLEFSEWFQDNFPIRYAFLMREKNKLNYQLGPSLEGIIKELESKING